MKTIKLIKLILPIIFITFLNCGKTNDDLDDDDHIPTRTSYLDFFIDGVAVQSQFNVTIPEENDGTIATVVASFVNQTSGGITDEVTHLRFSYYEPGEYPFDFLLVMPTETGVQGLGETTLNSFGQPEYPKYYITFIIDDEVAVYDNNNDHSNDINSHLYSSSISIDITEFEVTTNSIGLVVPAYIKGSIIGNGYYTAYTGPTTAPQKLLHSISGPFEYYINP